MWAFHPKLYILLSFCGFFLASVLRISQLSRISAHPTFKVVFEKMCPLEWLWNITRHMFSFVSFRNWALSSLQACKWCTSFREFLAFMREHENVSDKVTNRKIMIIQCSVYFNLYGKSYVQNMSLCIYVFPCVYVNQSRKTLSTLNMWIKFELTLAIQTDAKKTGNDSK